MEMEAKSFAPDKAQKVLQKIRDYKADLQGLRDKLKKASRAPAASGETARKELVFEKSRIGRDFYRDWEMNIFQLLLLNVMPCYVQRNKPIEQRIV